MKEQVRKTEEWLRPKNTDNVDFFAELRKLKQLVGTRMHDKIAEKKFLEEDGGDPPPVGKLKGKAYDEFALSCKRKLILPVT